MKQKVESNLRPNWNADVGLVNERGELISYLELSPRDDFYHITEDIPLDIGDVLEVVELESE